MFNIQVYFTIIGIMINVVPVMLVQTVYPSSTYSEVGTSPETLKAEKLVNSIVSL